MARPARGSSVTAAKAANATRDMAEAKAWRLMIN
jgi:hypothetical protein